MVTDRKAYLREYGRKYRQSERGKAAKKRYNQSEKGKAFQKKTSQSENRKSYQKEYNKKYLQSEKGKVYMKEYQRKYRQSEKGKADRKKYRESVKGKSVIEKRRKYLYYNNSIFKLRMIMRARVLAYLKEKKITKEKKTFEIVGCTPQELRTFIESKFQPGMTWDNWGTYGWHVDHVIPLSRAKTEDELMKLFHYTNLQPLWAKDNLLKSNKVIS